MEEFFKRLKSYLKGAYKMYCSLYDGLQVAILFGNLILTTAIFGIL
ncbi:hypothetical protein LEP1GSC040_3121 [Leptospira santarosai str. 2000030832]|uniref:Uncharacterized protein n=1 Tax=Leptospira santarosai serovar Arenal str. MAVJ 401 TaxID=1049976 RepID=M6JVX3_9LEPT|nr:hypothetical protein LEP1GSC040_3121 [Leptospira santarosai str. 2000030832]EMN19627.1 hypothetical protein LEP1GSC063_1668 [Leptospira santarosai serovar Arenal str. MAVJ 401]